MGLKITQPKARIKTGTYTGDGNATQAITGVGFKGKCVIVGSMNSDVVTWLKTDVMGANAKNLSATAYSNNKIISIDDDGFTVGNGGVQELNYLDYPYFYLVLRD